MYRFFILIAFLLNILSVQSQNNTFIYKDVFKFQLPKTIELLYYENINESCISKDDDTYSIIKTFNDDFVIWVPKEINENIFISTTVYEIPDSLGYPKRNEDFYMNEEMWEIIKESVKQDNGTSGKQFIRFCGFSKINFNGYCGYYISYIETKDGIPHINYEYTVLNGTKECRIYISYSETDAKKWNDVKNMIASSFTFDISDTNKEDSTTSSDNFLKRIDSFFCVTNEMYVISAFSLLFFLLLIFSYIYYKKESKI